MSTETRGRKPSSGRFDTRAELCDYVWRVYRKTPASLADIARQVRVSPALIGRILDSKEGMPPPQVDDVMSDSQLDSLEHLLPLPDGEHPAHDDGAAFRLQLRFGIIVRIVGAVASAIPRNIALTAYEPLASHATEERAVRVAVVRAAIAVNNARISS